MNKNRKSRRVIKLFIKQCIPKSSYRKHVIQQQENTKSCTKTIVNVDDNAQLGNSEKQYKAC